MCEYSKYLKSIGNSSKIMYDEIINVTDSANVANAIPTNVTSTASINCHNKKVRYKRIIFLLTFLEVTILLFLIASICNHYTNHGSKQKHVGTHQHYKLEKNNKFKKVDIKNRMCYYFGGTIKIKDFDLDNILLDEKCYENILIYYIWYKTLICVKPVHIMFNHRF